MILAIVQARSSSTRFPGKVLADLHGKPMILRQLERIRASSLIDVIVVATSSDPSDDPLADLLTSAGAEVRRGPLDDVVARFDGVVREFAPDTIVRLTADCPLTDPEVIDSVIRAHLLAGSDYTSNVLRPTFPDGLDVESFSAEAFARLTALPLTPREREHVTLGLYSRPSDFSLESVETQPDRSSLRWTVDIPKDLVFVNTVYSALYDGNPRFSMLDVVEFLQRHPEHNRTEQDLARNAGSQ